MKFGNNPALTVLYLIDNISSTQRLTDECCKIQRRSLFSLSVVSVFPMKPIVVAPHTNGIEEAIFVPIRHHYDFNEMATTTRLISRASVKYFLLT